MASSFCYRGYEVRVNCTEEKYHWAIVDIVVTREDIQTHATEFNLLPHYVSGEAALESGQIEGRRMVDEKLVRSGSGKT